MNIQFTTEDIKFLEEAKKLKDWHLLTTWKQRFMYQRFVALPVGDIFTVKEISAEAKKQLEAKNRPQEEFWKV